MEKTARRLLASVRGRKSEFGLGEWKSYASRGQAALPLQEVGSGRPETLSRVNPDDDETQDMIWEFPEIWQLS